jgi:aminoglycoside phosphotransferase (APT) family kinase protein
MAVLKDAPPPLTMHAETAQLRYDWNPEGERQRIGKYGRRNEANVLRAVAAYTSIPVPRILDERFDSKKGSSYLVMEVADGYALEDAWTHLGSEKKQKVKNQLACYIEQLRELPRHLVREPPMMTDRFFWPRCQVSDSRFRAAESDREFIDKLVGTLERTTCVYEDLWPDQVFDMLRSLPTGNGLVFTHGNLDPTNILIDEDANIVSILDWSQAGFYPVYWEYVKAHLWDFETEFVRAGGWDGVLQRFHFNL